MMKKLGLARQVHSAKLLSPQREDEILPSEFAQRDLVSARLGFGGQQTDAMSGSRLSRASARGCGAFAGLRTA
jgi:hypothetical protein